MPDIRNGAIVRLEGRVVAHLTDGRLAVDTVHHGPSRADRRVWVRPEDIKGVVSQPTQAGDRVRWTISEQGHYRSGVFIGFVRGTSLAVVGDRDAEGEARTNTVQAATIRLERPEDPQKVDVTPWI